MVCRLFQLLRHRITVRNLLSLVFKVYYRKIIHMSSTLSRMVPRTVEILKKYTGRVNWVSEPDNGQSDGLNRALQRCRGDIIGVLNADDEYLSHAASWAVENFAKFPHVAVIYGDQYFINADGIIIGEIHGQPYNFKKVLCVEDVIPAQAAFIRRTHFEQVGL
jgi:glycosyltransferase involved in cell wall biosynthesis